MTRLLPASADANPLRAWMLKRYLYTALILFTNSVDRRSKRNGQYDIPSTTDVTESFHEPARRHFEPVLPGITERAGAIDNNTKSTLVAESGDKTQTCRI